MRRLIVALAALLGVALLAGCGSSGGVTAVDPQAFLSTAHQPGAVVVDVRAPSEYAAGHVDGAINVDVEGGSFDAQIAQLDKGTTYAVYCHSGRRSALATDAMATAGFTHVYNLDGGIADLQAAGASIVG